MIQPLSVSERDSALHAVWDFILHLLTPLGLPNAVCNPSFSAPFSASIKSNASPVSEATMTLLMTFFLVSSLIAATMTGLIVVTHADDCGIGQCFCATIAAVALRKLQTSDVC